MTVASGRRSRSEREALLAARTLVDRMRALYRELENLTGAPIALHRALTVIDGEPGLRASQLADALGMQRPAVSHMLRALAARGWVERSRSEDDQRSVRLFVSAEGRKLLGRTSGRVTGTLQRAVSNLTDDELEQLATSLTALLESLPTHTPAGGDAR